VKKMVRAAALAGVVALALAACGEAPEEEPTGGGDTAETEETGEAEEATDFTGCMVTDQGGVDDRSFNQSAYEGLTALEESEGIEVQLAESTTDSDYAPNVAQFVQGDCGLIVTVGFLLATATAEAAEANPEERFALVDSTTETPLDNVKPLLFNTAEAAFLAGYVAGGMTETGTVATFGGINIPSVSIFMDGFSDGVDAFNEARGADVELLGWDKEAQDGSFTGNFEDQNAGRQLTENFIQQGADIILPVAGPVGLGAAAAAQETGGEVNLIWVDSDGFESASQFSSLFITSVLKQIDVAVEDATAAAIDDSFSSEPYVGTLENEGVGIAPYHDFEDAVPAELSEEVDALREQIISGELVIESPSTPG
jgi:basic membrane protein A